MEAFGWLESMLLRAVWRNFYDNPIPGAEEGARANEADGRLVRYSYAELFNVPFDSNELAVLSKNQAGVKMLFKPSGGGAPTLLLARNRAAKKSWAACHDIVTGMIQLPEYKQSPNCDIVVIAKKNGQPRRIQRGNRGARCHRPEREAAHHGPRRKDAYALPRTRHQLSLPARTRGEVLGVAVGQPRIRISRRLVGAASAADSHDEEDEGQQPTDPPRLLSNLMESWAGGEQDRE
jgi:hypothetical protein